MNEPENFLRAIFLLLLLLTTSDALFCQIIVETAGGETYVGMIIHETNDDLTIVTDTGDTLRFTSADLRFLDRNGEGPQEPEDYFTIGTHIGTPGYLLNVDVGYYRQDIRFRLTGGFFFASSLQLDVGYPLYQSANFSTDIYLAGGWSSFNAKGLLVDSDNSEEGTPNWTYIGAGLHTQWSLFFLSVGINSEMGANENLRLLGQLGFIWQMK